MINEFLRTMANLFNDLDKNFNWIVSAIGYILLSNICMLYFINDSNNLNFINGLIFINIIVTLVIGSYLYVVYNQNKITIRHFETIIKATDVIVAQDNYYNSDESLVKDHTPLINSLEEFYESETKNGQRIKLTKPFITWNIEELKNLLKFAVNSSEKIFENKIKDRMIELSPTINELEVLLKWTELVENYEFATKIKNRIVELNKKQ